MIVPAFSLGAQTLAIQSSDSLGVLGRNWVKGYLGRFPDARIAFTNATTAATLQALWKKEAALVLVPRSLRYPENQACEQALGSRPKEYKVAVNGLAICAHPENPLKEQNWQAFY